MKTMTWNNVDARFGKELTYVGAVEHSQLQSAWWAGMMSGGRKEAVMKPEILGAVLGCALLAGVSATAAAQPAPSPAEKPDLGKNEYNSSCAVCHGLTGKGEGPFARYLEKNFIPDITTLSKRNSGVFPFQRVYEIIDGTELVGAHGNRDMPIWGPRYKFVAGKQSFEFPYDPDVFARAYILALTEYVYRLQAK
jgi:hypothetical protein